MSGSATKFCRSPFPSWMTPDVIEEHEHINRCLFIYGLPGVPTWSMYYDPERSSDDEDFNDNYYHHYHHPRLAPKKVQNPVNQSTNRFAVFNKISENATTWTPKKSVTTAKRK